MFYFILKEITPTHKHVSFSKIIAARTVVHMVALLPVDVRIASSTIATLTNLLI
jgi:hypothetical protein